MVFKDSGQMTRGVQRGAMAGAVAGGYVGAHAALGFAQVAGKGVGNLINVLSARDSLAYCVVGFLFALMAYGYLYLAPEKSVILGLALLLTGQTYFSKAFWIAAARREFKKMLRSDWAATGITRGNYVLSMVVPITFVLLGWGITYFFDVNPYVVFLIIGLLIWFAVRFGTINTYKENLINSLIAMGMTKRLLMFIIRAY